MAANTFFSTNNKISNLISSEVPFFVRNDHQNFIRFLEAYYEFLEQNDAQISGIANNKQYNVITRIKNLQNAFDIDRTVIQFENMLKEKFLSLIPESVKADKALLLKNIKDFYRSKGNEKSATFLINILSEENKDIDYYYPRNDVLRASDGKWFIERSIKVTDVKVDDVINTNPSVVNYFANTVVRGNTSNATAVVERAETYYESGVLVKELKLSAIKGDFLNNEILYSSFIENGINKSITANLFGGVIVSTDIVRGGNAYSSGTEIPIVSNTGTDGRIIISSVTSGNISTIGVLKSGSGFRVNNRILFSGGGGSGANGIVSGVLDDGSSHPNSYNIMYSTISLEANTLIGNSVYSNLNSANANTTIANAADFFVYSNTGPILTVLLTASGNNYISIPTLDVTSNAMVRSLGILGSMEIVDGGLGYQSNDKIEFINVLGGYGSGALANVSNVDANGKITTVEFIESPGHIIGGSGYTQSHLPRANVISSTGNGANVIVTSILGDGESIGATTTSFGRITEVKIESGGSNYGTDTTLDLTSIGDGTALINVSVIQGLFTYPGRYLNDDGHLSSYNFLQNRDYYQNFSYVIRMNESISKYKKALLSLTHPAGAILFSENLFIDQTFQGVNTRTYHNSTQESLFISSTYQANLGNISINTLNNGLSSNDNVYLEFISGDTQNVTNGIYLVSFANTDYFYVSSPANTINTSGIVFTGIIQ